MRAALPDEVEAFLDALEKSAAPLQRESRLSTVRELRSHFAELVERSGASGALDALKSFGGAESYAATLADADAIENALASENPVRRLSVAVAAATSGTAASLKLAAAATLQLTSLSFAGLAILKLIAPEAVGFFVGPGDEFVIGFSRDSSSEGWREIAGAWILPAFVVLALCAHFCAAFFLRTALSQRSAHMKKLFAKTE